MKKRKRVKTVNLSAWAGGEVTPASYILDRIQTHEEEGSVHVNSGCKDLPRLGLKSAEDWMTGIDIQAPDAELSDEISIQFIGVEALGQAVFLSTTP